MPWAETTRGQYRRDHLRYASDLVERTFAWLGRNRRLAKDFEATIASGLAWLFIAHIRLLTRRLARDLYQRR